MQAVEDKMETIHLYVVREQPKKPYTVLPLLAAALCLLSMAAVTFYSAENPYYEHQRLAVPAIFLPLRVFTAQAPVIPTGVKTYPATTAYGMLTLTNGSVLSEVLPAGVIFSDSNGAEVQTTASAFIPAGSANGYGVATVPAKALTAGKSGNIPTLAINAVYGTALYVRNLSAFSGGKDGYSVSYATTQDKATALNTVRTLVAAQVNGYHYPCREDHITDAHKMIVTLGCQFVTYHLPSYMHVTAARLVGKKFVVDVIFLPRPKPVVFR